MGAIEGWSDAAGAAAGDGGAAGGELRASDADRERTAAIITDQAAAGRLDAGECADRLAAAFAARTLPELYALTIDLPYPDAVVPATALWPGAGRSESLLVRLMQWWSRK